MLLLGAAISVGTADAQEFDDGEIVVTAQKREQRLEDVPTSITVISRDDLITANVNDARDWVALAPNVSISAAGNSRFAELNIRGVQNVAGIVASNAVYLDEFGLTAGNNSSLVNLGTLDLESIEVLRGPQGVFYGRNSIGGAVQLVSAKPRNETTAELTAGYASFDSRKIEAIVNFAVTPQLYVRAAISHETTDGWIRNINPAFVDSNLPGANNGGRSTNYKAAARWQPNDRTTIDLRYLRSDQS